MHTWQPPFDHVQPSQFWRIKEGQWQQDDLWVANVISPELIRSAMRLRTALFVSETAMQRYPHVIQIQHYKFVWH